MSGLPTLDDALAGRVGRTEYIYQDASPRAQDARRAALDAAELRAAREASIGGEALPRFVYSDGRPGERFTYFAMRALAPYDRHWIARAKVGDVLHVDGTGQRIERVQ